MNDRFKFRVWDEKEKRFLDHPQINPLFGCVCGYENSTYPLQIEQCTGLKDKNGNLIYEGDIIRDKYMTEFVIKWVDSGFIMSDIDETQPDDGLRQGWLNLCEFEIIGNIHEQAEQKD